MSSILTNLLGEIDTNKNHSSSIERFKVILPEIERILNKRVVCYFASETGLDQNSLINDEDAFVIENLLSVPSDKDDLVLILHSNGGFSISAERIIEVCRSYCRKNGKIKKFLVLIPKRAKSAATILALGADKIYLRDTAELGPVDPQFNVSDDKGTTQFIPAYILVDSVENLIDKNPRYSVKKFLSFMTENETLKNLPTEVKSKFFDQCNYMMYVSAKNELGLSDSIIEKILNEKVSANTGISQNDFEIFRDPHITKSHGRLINLDDLKDNSLRKEGVINSLREFFETPEVYESIEPLLWELYVRKRQLLNDHGHNIVKMIETTDELFTSLGKKLGQA